MSKEIADQIGAMHERMLDDVDNYVQLTQLLATYSKGQEPWADKVIEALELGMKGKEHFLRMQNATSMRRVVIEAKAESDISLTDTEGTFRIKLICDDESSYYIHFDRRADQILYMVMLLGLAHGGVNEQWLRKDNQAMRTVLTNLAALVYPGNQDLKGMLDNLDPDIYLTECLQRMKSAIRKALSEEEEDEQQWFLPLRERNVYDMRLLPTHVIYPTELQTVAERLPVIKDDQEEMFLKEETVLTLIKEAQQGNGESMALLADCYREGLGVVQNMEKAFAWYEKGAEQKQPHCLYFLGVFYCTGDMVHQDYRKGNAYLRQAAEAGEPDAWFQLAEHQFFGFGMKTNKKAALKKYQKAAELGSVDAIFQLGYFYQKGKVVRKDKKKALLYFEQAAKQEHELGITYVLKHYFEDKQNHEKEINYWAEQAKEMHSAQIDTVLGYKFYINKEYKEALKWLKRAFDEGKSVSSVLISDCYRFGLGVEKDEEMAKRWVLKGANQGDEQAILNLKARYPQDWEVWAAKNEGREDTSTSQLRMLHIHWITSMDETNGLKYIKLVDAYRERYQEKYIEEMCKQLNIRKPNTDKDGNEPTRGRHITVRSCNKKKVKYEVVLRMQNGKEIVIDKLNGNALLIYITIMLCSRKSGYVSLMTGMEPCRKVMKKLVTLLFDEMSQREAELTIDKYLSTGDYYKQYTKILKKSLKDFIGIQDEADYFLFRSTRMKSQHELRYMLLEPSEITLPQEMEQLANEWMDARSTNLEEHENHIIE